MLPCTDKSAVSVKPNIDRIKVTIANLRNNDTNTRFWRNILNLLTTIFHAETENSEDPTKPIKSRDFYVEMTTEKLPSPKVPATLNGIHVLFSTS